MTAIYLKNRNPTKALEKTPHEEWSGEKPTIKHLRPFGCKAYVHVPVQKHSKLDSKSVEGIFIGYSEESKAYRIFDAIKREVNVTHDVIFDECRPSVATATYDEETNPNLERTDAADQKANQIEKSAMPVNDDFDSSAEKTDCRSPSEEKDPSDIIQSALHDISKAATEIRRSARESRQPERYDRDPKYAHLATIEPETYIDAINRGDSKQWEKAMDAEYESLMANDTWSIVDLPPNRKTIGC